ncbi:DUF4239 domain-containing protein [Methylobacter sp. S3L5C]|uniref:bestrophin-like domain n=1 Tax=Methylobacter sp. S3L5C TaxID=2839024 RepID=UPI001FAD5F4D|nr:DUF4239 domain-containing protein [Methylobacter sp. S3L5C]UOA09363.1 DUF4239 domain-containing protein [Methylobacter sp. S3L5C]
MSAPLAAFVIFVCMLFGMALGSYLRLVLPDHHTQADSKDILKTSAGMMATLIALIIGLLVTSAKGNYDNTTSGITQSGAKIITLGYYLSNYGPEAKEAQELVRQATASAIERIWPDESTQGVDLTKMETATGMAEVYSKIRKLSPQNDSQKYLQTQALQISADMMQSRWMLIEQSQTNLPVIFLVVLTFWLTVLFAQFGLLAPRNLTAKSALFICALSMTGAIFLILELNQPLEGIIKASSAPLQKSLSLIGK